MLSTGIANEKLKNLWFNSFIELSNHGPIGATTEIKYSGTDMENASMMRNPNEYLLPVTLEKDFE